MSHFKAKFHIDIPGKVKLILVVSGIHSAGALVFLSGHKMFKTEDSDYRRKTTGSSISTGYMSVWWLVAHRFIHAEKQMLQQNEMFFMLPTGTDVKKKKAFGGKKASSCPPSAVVQ